MANITRLLKLHSQKVALLSATGCFGLAFLIQPYYETLVRLVTISTEGVNERKPSERIRRIVDEVLSDFQASPQQAARLDVYVANTDQSVSVGSLQSGFAFIGLPFIFSYSTALQLPVDSLPFGSDLLPVGPYTPLGQSILDKAVLPDAGLRFLIARELVKLGLPLPNGSQASKRSGSLTTSGGIIAGLYAAYQTCYAINRTLPLAPPTRFLFYTLTSLLGLVGQYQLALAWRRRQALAADHLVVTATGHNYVEGARQYYTWRLEWNRFWAERQALVELQGARFHVDNEDSVANPSVTNKTQDTDQPSGTFLSTDSGYYLPESLATSERHSPIEHSMVLESDLSTGRFHLDGNERWSADGEFVGFGLTGILSVCYLPRSLSWLLATWHHPATSQQRLDSLATVATPYDLH